MSGEAGFGDGAGGSDSGFGGDTGAGAGAVGSYGGYNGSGDAVTASTRPAGPSRVPSPGGERQPAPSRHDTPPQSWAQDYHPHWHAIPEQVRGYLHQRESEATKRISELGPGAKEHASITQAFERYGHSFPAGDHGKAIEALLALDHLYRQDPRAAIARMAQAAGLDLRTFAGDGGQDPAHQGRLQQLMQENQALRQWQTQSIEQAKQAEQKRKAEQDKQIKEARRQSSLNLRSNGAGMTPVKGTLRQSLERHANRLMP